MFFATEEMLIEATKRKAAIALLQEPYVGGSSRMRLYRGVKIFQNTGEILTKAAIAMLNPHLDITQHPDLTTDNIAVVSVATKSWKLTLISCSFEPDLPIEPYLEHVTKIFKTKNRKNNHRW